MRTCSIEGCEMRHQGNGYCNMHYQRDRFGRPMDGPWGNPRNLPELPATRPPFEWRAWRHVITPLPTHLIAERAAATAHDNERFATDRTPEYDRLADLFRRGLLPPEPAPFDDALSLAAD